MTFRRAVAIVALLVGAGVASLGACSRLPSLENRLISSAALDTAGTRLGQAIVPATTAHPGLSGIYPLRDARDAFAARCRLAAAAERTLDVQYYIWRKDRSGTLLFKALQDAADRGVRVRLLLDDNNTSGLDMILAALDAHPRIEVRLFNPFVIRKPRIVGYLTDFSRLNRRMHNKSFTADNQATIVGGRNVGDEYFGATNGVLFSDVDVIAIGPVVKETSAEFDRYWESASSYPADRLLAQPTGAQIEQIKSTVLRNENDPATIAYVTAIRASPFVRDLVARRLSLEWAKTRLISDDPAKGLGRARAEQLLVEKMKEIFGTPLKTLDLVSPYFVPGSDGTRMLSDWSRRGVRTRILTNSLEATDVSAVHAGYARRRKALLEGGVRLYELRKSPGVQESGSAGRFGSSSASLHAKTFAIDDERVFVGSFNFDPRSTKLNTEMGFVIESAALAQMVRKTFDERVPARAYEVRLANDGGLYWIEKGDQGTRRLDAESGATLWRSAWVRLLSHLPIEWLL